MSQLTITIGNVADDYHDAIKARTMHYAKFVQRVFQRVQGHIESPSSSFEPEQLQRHVDQAFNALAAVQDDTFNKALQRGPYKYNGGHEDAVWGVQRIDGKPVPGSNSYQRRYTSTFNPKDVVVFHRRGSDNPSTSTVSDEKSGEQSASKSERQTTNKKSSSSEKEKDVGKHHRGDYIVTIACRVLPDANPLGRCNIAFGYTLYRPSGDVTWDREAHAYTAETRLWKNPVLAMPAPFSNTSATARFKTITQQAEQLVRRNVRQYGNKHALITKPTDMATFWGDAMVKPTVQKK